MFYFYGSNQIGFSKKIRELLVYHHVLFLIFIFMENCKTLLRMSVNIYIMKKNLFKKIRSLFNPNKEINNVNDMFC